MGKKKRSRKITVYAAVEGKTELALLEYLEEIYTDRAEVNITENPSKGGSSDKIVCDAIDNANKYQRCFAWFDEDMNLSGATRKKLVRCWNLKEPAAQAIETEPVHLLQSKFNSKQRNPVLIVSNPVCADGLILSILGKTTPHSVYMPEKRAQHIQDTKNTLKGVFNGIEPEEYYTKHLPKNILEQRRQQIPELDLLIRMICKPDDPNP